LYSNKLWDVLTSFVECTAKEGMKTRERKRCYRKSLSREKATESSWHDSPTLYSSRKKEDVNLSSFSFYLVFLCFMLRTFRYGIRYRFPGRQGHWNNQHETNDKRNRKTKRDKTKQAKKTALLKNCESVAQRNWLWRIQFIWLTTLLSCNESLRVSSLWTLAALSVQCSLCCLTQLHNATWSLQIKHT
jgi:hypothetical protein